MIGARPRRAGLFSRRRKPSICFIAPDACCLLSGRTDSPGWGGAEMQQMLIARWLVRRGYRVSFVTTGDGQADWVERDGISVYRAYTPGGGVSVLRFVHPRWTGLWAAMGRANADVYYQRTSCCETGQAAIWCHWRRRPLIVATASDAGCTRELPLLPEWQERVLARFGLKRATMVLAQTRTQRRLLREHFGISSIVLPNCYEALVSEDMGKELSSKDSMRVLWVGRISREKRLEWLLDVAEQCPEIAFAVVGAERERSEYSVEIIERGCRIENVSFYGWVPHQKVQDFYRDATVLCCTSVHEGFPNTFLEAWASGVPVVSTFDPDGLIAKHGLGAVAGTVQDLVHGIRQMVQCPATYRKISRKARRYCLEHHAIEKVMPRFEEAMLRVVAPGSR